MDERASDISLQCGKDEGMQEDGDDGGENDTIRMGIGKEPSCTNQNRYEDDVISSVCLVAGVVTSSGAAVRHERGGLEVDTEVPSDGLFVSPPAPLKGLSPNVLVNERSDAPSVGKSLPSEVTVETNVKGPEGIKKESASKMYTALGFPVAPEYMNTFIEYDEHLELVQQQQLFGFDFVINQKRSVPPAQRRTDFLSYKQIFSQSVSAIDAQKLVDDESNHNSNQGGFIRNGKNGGGSPGDEVPDFFATGQTSAVSPGVARKSEQGMKDSISPVIELVVTPTRTTGSDVSPLSLPLGDGRDRSRLRCLDEPKPCCDEMDEFVEMMSDVDLGVSIEELEYYEGLNQGDDEGDEVMLSPKRRRHHALARKENLYETEEEGDEDTDDKLPGRRSQVLVVGTGSTQWGRKSHHLSRSLSQAVMKFVRGTDREDEARTQVQEEANKKRKEKENIVGKESPSHIEVLRDLVLEIPPRNTPLPNLISIQEKHKDSAGHSVNGEKREDGSGGVVWSEDAMLIGDDEKEEVDDMWVALLETVHPDPLVPHSQMRALTASLGGIPHVYRLSYWCLCANVHLHMRLRPSHYTNLLATASQSKSPYLQQIHSGI